MLDKIEMLELNKIYHGDNLHYLKTMPDECVDLVYIDPPFGTQTLQKSNRSGSMTYTDDNPSYDGALRRHKTVNHSAKEYVNGMAHTNSIESVWAVLKRGYNGVYHNWSKKRCQQYVNELSFRLNEGNCEADTQDRLDALFARMGGKQMTYKELTR